MYGSKFYDIKKEESLEILLISIVISICGVVAIIINDALNFDYPFWAATAAIVIFSTGSSLTIYKSWRRVVATIIGSIIGLYLSILFVEFSFVGILIIFLIGAIFLFFSKIYPQEGYFLLFIGLHISFIGAGCIVEPTNAFYLTEYRILTNIVGVLCALIFVLILPIKKGKSFSPATPLSDQNALLNTTRIFIAMSLAVLFWMFVNVPGGSINMIITIVIISGVEINKTVLVFHRRFFGCLLGVSCGIACIVISSYLPIVIFPLFILSSTIFTYFALQHPLYGYAYEQANRAFMIVCFPTKLEFFSFSDGAYRALGIFIALFILLLIEVGERVLNIISESLCDYTIRQIFPTSNL
ncbi:FUSC family protein [Francisella philomiragia]|uniref:FUSC family protein n=1 Tax=Francisella philomiragia TaxID=28110 RepID=UPI00190347B2|nr:FUSC family protein [Francisella philomiragia]MBK2105532.1 FUSC family protein [Francisella philomiragia]